MERESLDSTGLGGRVVTLPHAKLHFSPQMVVVGGKANRGIDFQTFTQKPQKLFLLIIAIINRENIFREFGRI